MDTVAEAVGEACPTWEILAQIADKWTTLVIGTLASAPAPVRFGQLRKAVTGISQKMLSQTLRNLERGGLVSRVAYPVIPPRVEYSLTSLGRTLEEPLGALALWAREHSHEVRVAQAAFEANHGTLKAGNAA